MHASHGASVAYRNMLLVLWWSIYKTCTHENTQQIWELQLTGTIANNAAPAFPSAVSSGCIAGLSTAASSSAKSEACGLQLDGIPNRARLLGDVLGIAHASLPLSTRAKLPSWTKPASFRVPSVVQSNVALPRCLFRRHGCRRHVEYDECSSVASKHQRQVRGW